MLKTLAKSIFVRLGSTTAASAANAATQKSIFGSRNPLDLANQTKLIISNKEMDYITKIVNFLEDISLLIKNISETI